jgi:hypothetical protein
MMRTFFVALVGAAALATAAGAQHSNLGSLFDRYTVDPRWAQLPEGWDAYTSSAAADGNGTVIVLVRSAPHVRIFSTDGRFQRSWGGDGLFALAHSVHASPDGTLWVTDPNAHVVQQFSRDGQVLRTLGVKGTAGDNSSHDAFNQPNSLGFGPDGDIFVSDGYGNSRVVQFTSEGRFVRIIGGKTGTGPGELQAPHGVAIDPQGRIVVADSGNKRLAIFDREGRFVKNVAVPSRGGIEVMPDGTMYVSDVNAGAVTVLKNDQIVDVIKVDGRPHGLGVDRTTGDVYTASTQPGSPNVTRSTLK